MKKLNKFAQIEIDTLIKGFIAIMILAASIAGVILMKDKGGNIFDAVHNIFRFGR